MAGLPDVLVGFLKATHEVAVEVLNDDPKLKKQVERELKKVAKRYGVQWVVEPGNAARVLGIVNSLYSHVKITSEAASAVDGGGGHQPAANDPYARLGVTRDAPMEVVTAAYRALAQLYHPDKGGDGKRMAMINEAYAAIQAERK